MKTCEKCDEDPEVPDKDFGKSHSLFVCLFVMGPGDPVMDRTLLRGSASSPRGWRVCYTPSSSPPKREGIGRDPTASLILTPQNSCDLTPPMRGTQQNWNLI